MIENTFPIFRVRFYFVIISYALAIIYGILLSTPWIEFNIELSRILFCIILITTLFSNRYGFILLIFLLPLTGSLNKQIEVLFGLKLGIYANPGLDLVFGFVTAYLISNCKNIFFWSQEKRDEAEKFSFNILFLFHIYLIFSTIISLFRNLSQSGSVFSVKGFFFNFVQIRVMDYLEDYFPLQELFIMTLGIVFFFIVYRFLKDKKEKLSTFIITLIFSNFLVFGYAIFQSFSFRGYFKTEFARGTHSFFSDLHSFAGFELIVLFCSMVLFISKNEKIYKVLGVVGSIISIFCLVLSKSKFTIFITPIIAFIAFYSYFPKRRSFRAIGLITASLIFIVAVSYVINIKQVDILMSDNVNKVDHINQLLSNRPELFKAALSMFEKFPLTGIGIGSFFRQSGIEGFSTSSSLVKRGGGNTHNYVLQLLTELGIVGAILISLLIVFPKKHHSLPTTSIILLSILASNIYAHSLLEREIFAIFIVILVIHHLRSEDTIIKWFEKLKSLYQGISKYKYFLVSFLFFIVIFEIGSSFFREPFRYGRLCHLNISASKDLWNRGLVVLNFPEMKSKAFYSVFVGHADIGKSPVFLEYGIMDNNRNVLEQKVIALNHNHLVPIEIQKKMEMSIAQRPYIKINRCYTPKNLGVSIDKRILGLSIRSTKYL